MFYQYRDLLPGEFIVVGGDCSQGGNDYNVCQFVSKTMLDVPIVYRSQGVAAQMTGVLIPALERIYDRTGIKPVVALERNNGGASEMERLDTLNRNQKYSPYTMRSIGVTDRNETSKLGFDTTSATRPMMLGDLKKVIDEKAITIYDKATINELFSFVRIKGKPQAEEGSHDDTIFALAIAWQLFQTERAPVPRFASEFIEEEKELFKGGFY